jgi:hypothetical protein
MQIDCSDVRYELRIGDGVRRSLIRHFRAFISQQIRGRGFDAEDPMLFNQDTLEAEAWRLAATVIHDAESEFCGNEYGSLIGDEIPASASEFLDAHLREALPEIEREYLDAALSGLGTLIDIAARTPIPIAGADQSVELGMGPQAEDDS